MLYEVIENFENVMNTKRYKRNKQIHLPGALNQLIDSKVQSYKINGISMGNREHKNINWKAKHNTAETDER